MSNARKNELAARKIEHIAAEIRRMDVRVDNMVPLGPKIGAMLSRDVSRQFTTQGVYMGTPWKPLKPSTIRDKILKGYPAPNPLVRTRELKLSFTSRPMSIEKYTPHSLTYGSSLRKALWQQKGTRRHGRRHIPPRVMFKVTRERKAAIKKLIVKYVATGRT